MMGNSSCENETDSRHLRRRVQLGVLEAEPIPLPNGGSFNFKQVANAQLQDVLRRTQSFSTSTVSASDPLDPSGMTQEEKDMFYQCEDTDSDFSTKSWTEESACMINMPVAKIGGQITGFELTMAVGGSIGYHPIGSVTSIGADVMVKQAKLTMELQAKDPLVPGLYHATSSPSAKQQEVSVNAQINFGQWSIGPSVYFKSALADVVRKALDNGVTDLKNQFDKAEDWYGMVLKNCDKAVIINAGNAADAGLQEGDVLEIYNTRYRWEGQTCESTLLGASKSTPKPIAIGVVRIVGSTFAQVDIIKQENAKVLPGARVYWQKPAKKK